MQSISKNPLQHCICLPSLPHQASLAHLPSLPSLAGQTAGMKSEKLLHHMSRIHGRRATPCRDHIAFYPFQTILGYELSFIWQVQAMTFTMFVKQMLGKGDHS